MQNSGYSPISFDVRWDFDKEGGALSFIPLSRQRLAKNFTPQLMTVQVKEDVTQGGGPPTSFQFGTETEFISTLIFPVGAWQAGNSVRIPIFNRSLLGGPFGVTITVNAATGGAFLLTTSGILLSRND